METGAMADVQDKGRASAAIGALRAASSAAKDLATRARPLAMQDNESHQAEVAELSTKLAAAKAAMFQALAAFFAHLRAESTVNVQGNDTEATWTAAGMEIRHLHPTYDIVVAAQQARAAASKPPPRPDGGDDGGHVNDPLDGGAPGGMDPPG